MRRTFELLAVSGLRRFNPNVLASPDTPYNLAHENVAIESFKEVAKHFAYLFKRNNLETIDQPNVLRSIYRHFVFEYMKKKVKMEIAEEGSVEATAKLDVINNRRKQARTIYNGLSHTHHLLPFNSLRRKGRIR